MNVLKYDLIIFDCDGTLVDSEYLNNKVTSDLLIDFGLTEYTPERCIAEFAGSTWSDIKALLDARHQTIIPRDIIQTYIARVAQEMDTYPMTVAGAVEFVGRCQSSYKIAVGSNGERSNVIKSLKLGGFDCYFQEPNIFTKIQVEKGKPAPDLFLYAANQMGVAPEKCLVIEDSSTGAMAGKAAGMDVFGFIGAAHDKKISESSLKKAGVCQVFDNFIHMAEALKL